MRQQHSIHKKISVATLIILYVVFFAAQLFSVNPDLPGKHNTVVIFGSKSLAAQKVATIQRDDNAISADQPVTLRLNKRFQLSETFCYCPELISFNPPIPFESLNLGSYLDGFTSSAHGNADYLRGPPETLI